MSRTPPAPPYPRAISSPVCADPLVRPVRKPIGRTARSSGPRHACGNRRHRPVAGHGRATSVDRAVGSYCAPVISGQRRPVARVTGNWPPLGSPAAVAGSPGTGRENRSTNQSVTFRVSRLVGQWPTILRQIVRHRLGDPAHDRPALVDDKVRERARRPGPCSRRPGTEATNLPSDRLLPCVGRDGRGTTASPLGPVDAGRARTCRRHCSASALSTQPVAPAFRGDVSTLGSKADSEDLSRREKEQGQRSPALPRRTPTGSVL